MRITPEDCDYMLEKLALYLRRWKHDPLAYVIEAVGDTPTHQQAEILRALPREKFVAIRSGHGIGKSKMSGWIVNWYLDCHKRPGTACKIPCTAGTASQLTDVLWPEIAAVCEKKLAWLSRRYEITNDLVRCKENGKQWFASLRTARKDNPDALQGFHQCLFMIDEASAIPDEVFEVARGAMGDPDSYGVMTGNPTKLSGYFHTIFTKKTVWFPMHFSSTGSLSTETYSYPYVNPWGDIELIHVKGRQTPEWVQAMRDEYGEHSNAFKIRVLGEFASGDDDLVVEPRWLDSVWSNPTYPTDGRLKVMGVDVARTGNDDSALVLRCGNNVLFTESWHGCDLVESRQRLIARYKELQPDKIFIDIIGVGAGLYDECRHRGLPVQPVTVSEKAPEDNDADCRLLRDWLWWRARKFFRTHKVHFDGNPDSAEWKMLMQELISPTYSFKNGKVVVESKDDMRKRGAHSPNLADALNMTFMADFEAKKKVHKLASALQKRKKSRFNKRSWAVV